MASPHARWSAHAFFIQSCDDATYWLRSADAVQVRTFANAPAKNIYLTGGYEAIFGKKGSKAQAKPAQSR